MTKTATIHAQQRWEYMSISRKTDSYLANELNSLGQEGWELVSINYARGKKEEMFWTAFLKRPSIGQGAPVVARQEAPARHDPGTAPAGGESATLQGFDLEGDEFSIHDESDKPQ